MSRLNLKAQRFSAVICAFILGCSESSSPDSVAKIEAANESKARPTIASRSLAVTTDARTAKPPAYKSALKAGRVYMKESRYPAAALEFERALDAHPGDARAYSELAWATFHSGDASRALEYSNSAVAAGGPAKLRAASLYTLARIRESQGDIAAARSAYVESLALRPRKSVERRMAALQSSSKNDTDTKLSVLGPFASLPEFCSQYGNKSILAVRYPGLVKCDPRPRVMLRGTRVLTSASIFEIRVRSEETDAVTIQLALEVGEKWFVVLDAVDYEDEAISLRDENASLKKLERDLIGLRFLYPRPGAKGRDAIQCTIESDSSRPECRIQQRSE